MSENNNRKQLQNHEERIKRLEQEVAALKGEKPHLPEIPQPKIFEKSIEEIKQQRESDWKTVEQWLGTYGLQVAGMLVFLVGMGFFFKYAIDKNWISPLVRVLIGLATALGLVAVGEYVSKRAWSLACVGGGVALGYVSLFAARQLYHLVSLEHGYIALALWTLGSVALSLRHKSQMLAWFGLIGGFVLSHDISFSWSNPTPLYYVLAVAVGIIAVALEKGYAKLALMTLFLTTLYFPSFLTQFEAYAGYGVVFIVLPIVFALMRRGDAYTQGMTLTFGFVQQAYFLNDFVGFSAKACLVIAGISVSVAGVLEIMRNMYRDNEQIKSVLFGAITAAAVLLLDIIGLHFFVYQGLLYKPEVVTALLLASIVWLVIAKRNILASIVGFGISVMIIHALIWRVTQPMSDVFTFDMQTFLGNYEFIAALGAFAVLCACVVYMQRKLPVTCVVQLCKGAFFAVPAVFFFSYFFSLADSLLYLSFYSVFLIMLGVQRQILEARYVGYGVYGVALCVTWAAYFYHGYQAWPVSVAALVLGVAASVLAYCIRKKIWMVQEFEHDGIIEGIWLVGVITTLFAGYLWLPVRAVAFRRELVLAVYYGVATLVTLVAGLKLNERVIRYCGFVCSGISLYYVFLTVFSFASTVARIFALFAVGVVFVAASFAYQKLSKKV